MKKRAPTPVSLREALGMAWELRRYFLPLLPLGLVVLGIAFVQADLILGATSLTKRLVDAFGPADQADGSLSTSVFFGPVEHFIASGHGMAWLVTGVIVLLVLSEGLSLVVEQIRFLIAQRFRAHLQKDLLQAFVSDVGAGRQQRDTAAAQVTFSQDAGGLGMFLIFGLLGCLEQITKLGQYANGLSRITSGGWMLAAILIPAAFVFKAAVMGLFLRWEQRANHVSDTAMMDSQRAGLNFFGTMSRLVYLGGERSQMSRLLDASAHAATANRTFQLTSSLHGSLSNLLGTLAMPLAALLMLHLSVSSGQLVQAQSLFALAISVIGSILSFPGQFIHFSPSLRRVTQALRTPSPGPEPAELAGLRQAGVPALSVRRFAFGYDPDGPLLLNDISFEVPSGALVCIVGTSGAGKSTLARLLMGERVPQAGSLLIGGVDVTAWHLWWRRHLIGFLPAEVGLLQDTIDANLRFGRPDISDEAAERAVRSCLLEGVVATYGDKPLVAGDEQLSTGQQRRLGVARLLLGTQPVWIVDEPLANLDPHHMTEVAQAIRTSASGHTTLIITHDPGYFDSTFNVFLHGGRVEACGTHHDLLRDNELYRGLFGSGKTPQQSTKVLGEK